MTGADRTPLLLLHSLGGSGRSWDWVASSLGDGIEWWPVDLPGFGDEAGAGAVGVGDTVDWLTERVRERAPRRWLVAGHSMGGKIAAILAARAAAGGSGLKGLAGVALIAASPPVAEPMAADARRRMVDAVAAGPIAAADALALTQAAVANPLTSDRLARTVADLRRCSPDAYRAWVERGSQEDWADQVGQVDLPALIVAGAADRALGEASQHRLTLPHFPRASVEVVADAMHLLPLEQPVAVAALLTAFHARLD